MVVSKTNIRWLKVTGCGVFMSGGIWVWLQFHKINQKLNQLVKADVLELERKRAEYIYVHDPHFKDRTTLLHTESEAHIEANQSSRSVLNVPMRWWKSWRNSYAWRLLSMAQNGDIHDRLKAVHTLATLKSLSDSDRRQLAQVCDERTAIGLARIEGVNMGFFLPPPYRHKMPSKQELTVSLHMFLEEVNKQHKHQCIQYFLRKAFPSLHQKHLNFLDDLTAIEIHQRPIRDEELLQLCIESLLHHATIENNVKDIVCLGGLRILMDAYKYFIDNIDVLIMLGKMMSYISLHQEMLHDVFVSGWVGILAQWAKHPDVRLSAPAVRALANFDTDDQKNGTYSRRLYLLHPTVRKTFTPKVDVVVVHGLLGGAFISWRQRDRKCEEDCGQSVTELPRGVSDQVTQEYLMELTELIHQDWDEVLEEYEMVMHDCPEAANASARGPFSYTEDHRMHQQAHADKECYTQCWPKDWLPNDCRYLRIIGVNYDTNISQWAVKCPYQVLKRSIEERSAEVIQKLKLAGIGTRPVVWIAHSMGGLLVKNILVQAWESGDKALEQMCSQTRGIVFYSTPHFGSPMAAIRAATTLLLSPTVEVKELRENSPTLLSLHKRFLRMIELFPVQVISFAETKTTRISTMPPLHYNFVPLSSADLGVGEFFVIPQDHLNICKPATRQSFLYQKVLQLINECSPPTQQ